MANSWSEYIAQFTGDENAYASYLASYITTGNAGLYFHEYVSDSDQTVIDLLLAQNNVASQIAHLSGEVYAHANAVAASGEDAKWAEFKSLFPVDIQLAIQVIIDKERIGTLPATTFASFKARSATTHATNILALHTAPYDFWTPYIGYFKRVAAQSQNGWTNWISSISDAGYRKTISQIVDSVANHGYLGDENKNFEAFRTSNPVALAEALFPDSYYIDNYYFANIYFALLIRGNLDTVFSGYYATEVDRRKAFIALFRPELQTAIDSYLTTLVEKNWISSFDGLQKISGIAYFLVDRVVAAGPSAAQQSNLQSFYRWQIGPGQNQLRFEQFIGDKLAFDINGTDRLYYTVAGSETDTLNDVAALINNATGEWTQVTATVVSGKVQVVANANNVPFEIASVNIRDTFRGTYYLINGANYWKATIIGVKHPIFLAAAQSILKDTENINSIELLITKTLKGQVSFKDANDNIVPATDIVVQLFDLENSVHPRALGSVHTTENGLFSLDYTVLNSAITTKPLRLQAKDAVGNEFLITTDLESNIFTDASYGTFAGGTPPDYTAWDLVKGTNIKIAPSESIGHELMSNPFFQFSSGDWYTSFPQTTLVINGNSILNLVGSDSIYTGNIFVTGRKYRATFTSIITGGNTPTVTLQDQVGTYYSVNTPSGIQTIDFVATSRVLNLTVTDDIGFLEFSIKEILVGENNHEGNFSPKFYLDASVPTNDYVFKGDTAIPVTINTNYEIEAYVYFNDAVVASGVEINSGLYLRPVSLGFADLTETIVHNGNRKLEYVSGNIKSSETVQKGQWVRIYSRFNSEAATSIKLGVYLKGTLADYTSHFAFQIDGVKLLKAKELAKDFVLDVNTSVPQVTVYIEDKEKSSISSALVQAAGASQPQITNVFPGEVKVGDVFVLDLNHEGTVSFKATENNAAHVITGLVAAVTKDTAYVQLIVNTFADPSYPQIEHIYFYAIRIGAVFTLRLNSGSSLSITAASTSSDDLTAAFASAINEQTAELVITQQQLATQLLPHVLHLTPEHVRAGAKYVLQLNGTGETVEFVSAGTSVANVVTGLVSAIGAASGQWQTHIVATAGVANGYVVLTGLKNGVQFTVQQLQGSWKGVYATDDPVDNKLIVTGAENNVPFTVTQTGGNFKPVYATDETDHLSLIAVTNDEPFALYVSVQKADDTGIAIDTMFRALDIPVEPEISQAFFLRGYTSILDILKNGLLKQLAGDYIIKVIQKAGVGVPHIVDVYPLNVNIGDIFGLTINGGDTVAFVATEATITSVVSGLLNIINASSGDWDTVTVTAVDANHLHVVANSNNVKFTIAQSDIGDGPTARKINSIASLYTVAHDLGVSDDKQIAVIEALLKAGYQDAFALTSVSKEEFAITVNQLVGDFNAARMYEIAISKKLYTQRLMNQLAGVRDKSLLPVSKNTANQLGSILKESCACDDCETAVSPLAYLTDLTNYVVKHLKDNNKSISIEALNTLFHQDFEELPASCDDVINLVCQLRVSSEVLRSYIASKKLSTETREQLQENIRQYVIDLYNQFLFAFGTSYDEIRTTVKEEDKKELALRLGIHYGSNPDFLDKLYISSEVLNMDTWDEYETSFNKDVQPLFVLLSDELSASPHSLSFAEFRDLSALELKDIIKTLSSGNSNDFWVEFGRVFIKTTRVVFLKVAELNLPDVLKKQMRWDLLVYELTKKFSVTFQTAFEVFVSAYRNYFKQIDKDDIDKPYLKAGEEVGDIFYRFIYPDAQETQYAKDIASYMIRFRGPDTDNGNEQYDFILPFASALLTKVEDFSITEKDLEELFGTRDTTKDIYSDGAKINDGGSILKRWNIRGIDWGRNTDQDGYVYLLMDEADKVIELYKDVAKGADDKVGVATPDGVTGDFIISEINDSGLSGQLRVSELDGTSEIILSLVPLLLSWKLKGLRANWKAADHFDNTPVIDPDLLFTTDFRYPYDINTSTPEKAIDFWAKRQEELSGKYDDYKDAREDADEFHAYGTTELDNPGGIGLGSDGILYIADTGNNAIKKLTGSTISTVINTGLSAPKQLLVTADDRLIFADSLNTAVKQYAKTGGAVEWTITGSSTSSEAFANNVFGVALGLKNDLFVTDQPVSGGRIQRFTLPYDYNSYKPVGLLTIETTTPAAATIKQVTTVTPSRITLGDTFKLTLQDTGSVTYIATSTLVEEVVNALQALIGSAWTSVEVKNNTSYLTFTAVSVNTPFTLVFEAVPLDSAAHVIADALGNRFVSDPYNGRVLKLDEEGQVVKVFGNANSLAKTAQVLLRFQELTGSIARDAAASSAVHDGTVNGTYSWQGDNEFSSALKLETSAYVSIASHGTLDNGTFTKRSLELWFKADGITNKQVLYKHGTDSIGMNIYLESGVLYAGIYGDPVPGPGGEWKNFLSTQAIKAEQWHHLVVVFDNGVLGGYNKFRAYLDGIEFFTDGQGNNGTGIEATSAGLKLGANVGDIRFADDTTSSATGFYFVGSLAGFRLWNRALDQNEVNLLFAKIEKKDGSVYLPGPLALDKANSLYVADRGNSRIVKFDAGGLFVANIGNGYGEEDGQFKTLTAIAIDKVNNFIYVSDNTISPRRVQQFNDLGYLSKIQPSSPVFGDLGGLAVDPSGVLYVADKTNNNIRLFNNGTSTGAIGSYTPLGGSSTNFADPSVLSIDTKGQLLVYDEGVDKVIWITNDGTSYTLSGNPWLGTDNPSSLSVDGDNYLYLGYTTNFRRVRFAEAITSITVPADISLFQPTLSSPSAVAVDRNGNVWVADTGHHRILKLTPQGAYLNNIGKADNTTGTGPGQFNAPSYVALDEAGNLYVSDTNNNRIQKFDSSGEYLTEWTSTAFTPNQQAPAGIALDKDRKLFVAQGTADKIFVFDSMQGISAALYSALSIRLGDLLLLNVSEKKGIDIQDSLEKLFLSIPGYRQLLRLVELADRRIPLLEKQLTELYNILVRTYKESQVSLWKQQEETAGIYLSQDHFVVPLLRQEEELVFNEWRTLIKERYDWTGKLASRIEQEGALRTDYEENISETEGDFLIRLRNILIEATDFNGNTLEEKAQNGSNVLLIDLKNACCQRTTRISMALEVLQNLMWGLHNGILNDNFPTFTIDSTIDFKEEWKWMGSYANWKAAQTVFLYPENLLLPSYHNLQSSGFKKFTESLRANPQLTNDTLEDYVAGYYDYFDDVNNLQLLDAIVAPTLQTKEQKGIRQTASTVYKNCVYLFAVGTRTNNFYWTKMESKSDKYEQVDFWNQLELPNAVSLKFVQAVRLFFPDNKHYLVVFFLDDTTDTPKLLYVKLDLQTSQWTNEPVEVDLPDFGDGYNGKFKGVYIDRKNGYDDLVYEANPTASLLVVVHRGVRQIYYKFDKELKKLKAATEDEYSIYGRADGDEKPHIPATTLLSFANSLSFYIDNTRDTAKKRVFLYQQRELIYYGDRPIFKPVTMLVSTTWPGPTESTASGYRDVNAASIILYKDQIADRQIIYKPMDKNWEAYMNEIQPDGSKYDYEFPYVENLDDKKFISHALIKDKNHGQVCMFVMQRNDGTIVMADAEMIDDYEASVYDPTSPGTTYTAKGKHLKISNDEKILFSKLTFNQYPQPDSGELANYRTAITSALDLAYTSGNKFSQGVVKELYYSVPLSAALALQKKGAYEDSLKWYKLIYDYSAFSEGQRIVYTGLAKGNNGDGIIDKFGTETFTIRRLVDQDANDFTIVSNPLLYGNNSDWVGKYKPFNSYTSGLLYELNNNLYPIDFDSPEFSLYVYDPTYSGEHPQVYVILGNSVNGTSYYKRYGAQLSGDGWQKLNFSLDAQGGLPASQVNSIKIQIFSNSTDEEKLFYLDEFIFRGKTTKPYEKSADWLEDPINPHQLADSRPDAYLRYTILSIASCLVQYADSEYTLDTVESVPRARLLYESALDLMEGQGLGGTQEICRLEINAFDVDLSDAWYPLWLEIKQDLYKIKAREDVSAVLEDIRVVMLGGYTEANKIKLIRNLVNAAIDNPELFRNISKGLYSNQAMLADLYLTLHSDTNLRKDLGKTSNMISFDFQNTITQLTGISPQVLISDQVFADSTIIAKLLRAQDTFIQGNITLDMITGSTDDLTDVFKTGSSYTLQQSVLRDVKTALARATSYKVNYIPSTNFTFCIPSNTLVDALKYNAQINLFKIRSCRNISGEVRELSPFAASIQVSNGLSAINGGAAVFSNAIRTFTPSQYRYETLIERSKQLVQIAQQVEASMLATLEKLDAERYSMLKAKQDLGLSKAGIKLQDLRTREAESGVRLAELQKERAQFQYDHFKELIENDKNKDEKESILYLLSAIGAHTAAASLYIIGGAISAASSTPGAAGAAVSGVGQATSSLASILSTFSQISSMNASFERRKEEWNFQKGLAQKDVAIGGQQIKIAKDQLAVVGQERNIAQLQADNAEATIDFLSNKFTNAELYDWMSNVLDKVYRYFLQQATVSARLAASQLSFERQQQIPDYIQNDYWQAPVDNLLQSGTLPGDKTVDRKGITGSTRLLQDIYQLDQDAFSSDVRKLELTKTISLASLSPAAFQRFKATGELPFDFSLSLFDRDFPGHYLRLIRSVKTSVIALVPPIDGVKASLSNTGVSRVVIENLSNFQKVQVKRPPESIVLTSATNANGLFELNPINNTKLLPFEKTGVESQWVFRLPKASNFFDFNSIADVLLTIEYTALYSEVYKSKLMKNIAAVTTLKADKSFSFKNNFADQWYDLNNPGEVTGNVSISFDTRTSDFPANIENITIDQLQLYLVASDELKDDGGPDSTILKSINSFAIKGGLVYQEKGKTKPEPSGNVTAVEALISTRAESGSAWLDFQDSSAEGTWTLTFTPEQVLLFKKGFITDLLFVISYEADTALPI